MLTGISNEGFVLGMAVLAAALAVMPAFGAGVGQGRAAGDAVQAIARQPEAKGDILQTMIIGQAITETSGIYGLIISLIILFTFAYPILGMF